MTLKNLCFSTIAFALLSISNANAALITSFNTINPGVDLGVPDANRLTGPVEQASDPTTGTVIGQRRSPWIGTGINGTYTAVKAGELAEYDVALTNKLFIMLGSPDSYNTIIFFKADVEVDRLEGPQILSDTSSPGASGFVNLEITTKETYDEVHFLSSRNSIEYANMRTVPSPVPEPSTYIIWSLMGLVATALCRIRR